MPPAESFTIEELARRTQMTVRALRSWNSKGLLPAPEIRGRTGYYTRQHVRRVERVRALVSEGYNLGVIARMLASADDEEAVVEFARAVVSSHGDSDQDVIVERADLVAPWDDVPASFVDDLVALRLVEPAGDGRFRVASPRLMRITERLAAEGIPATAVLEVTRVLSEQTDAIAAAYLELFVAHVWGGWDSGLDAERDWTALRERMLRLRELSGDATAAMVALKLDQRTESSLEQLER